MTYSPNSYTTTTEVLVKESTTTGLSIKVLDSTLPSGAATSAHQVSHNTKLDSLLTEMQLKADLSETQPVSVSSVIAGTGATNLGKAIDNVVGVTDTGVLMLAKHKEDSVHLSTADGDYDAMTLDSRGGLNVNVESHHVFDDFNSTSGWSVLNDDTANVATTKKHVSGTDALTFDKVNGTANTIFAGIQKTLSSVDLGSVSPHDILQGSFYIPDIANVAYVFLRIGTDSTNYNEWRLPDTALTSATFETGAQSVGDVNYAGITGNGWNPAAITYVAVGVAFDNQTDALAGIVFDEVSYHTNQHTSAIIGSEVTSEVSSANINVQKIGGSAVDKGSGNLSTGTQRMAIATDDINMAAIKTAVEILDNAISGNEMQVDIVTIPAVAITGTVSVTGGLTDTELRASAFSVLATGAVADDVAASGNPVPIGAIARTTNRTAVADADAVRLIADDIGRQVVAIGQVRDLMVHQHTQIASSAAETTVLTAGAAGVFHDITQIVLTNATATAVTATVKDATAGTTRMIIALAASGGAVIPFSRPLTQAAAAQNWTITLSSAAVTVNIFVQAEKNV